MNFKDTCKILLSTLLVIIIWILMPKYRLYHVESFEQKDEVFHEDEQKDENLLGFSGENTNVLEKAINVIGGAPLMIKSLVKIALSKKKNLMP